MEQRLLHFLGEGNALLDFLRRLQQHLQGRRLHARFIEGGRRLKIQRAGAVRTRVEEIGQLIESVGIRLSPLDAEQFVENDPPPPCVRRAVSQAAGHGETLAGGDDPRRKRQFRRVEGNRVRALEILLPIVEEQPLPLAEQPTGDHRRDRFRQPDPDIGLSWCFFESLRSHPSAPASAAAPIWAEASAAP